MNEPTADLLEDVRGEATRMLMIATKVGLRPEIVETLQLAASDLGAANPALIIRQKARSLELIAELKATPSPAGAADDPEVVGAKASATLLELARSLAWHGSTSVKERDSKRVREHLEYAGELIDRLYAGQ
jgi:hypothetical protein